MRELDVSGVIPREVRSWRSLHSAPILVMTYSPLSNLLATGSSDFNVLVRICIIIFNEIVSA